MKRICVLVLVVCFLLPALQGSETGSLGVTDPPKPDPVSLPAYTIYNDTVYVAEHGIFSLGDETGDWTNTTAKDSVAWGSGFSPASLELQFDSDDSSLAAFDYAIYAKQDPSPIHYYDIDLYNFSSSSWDEVEEISVNTYTWFNGSIWESDYWNSTGGIRLRLESNIPSGNDLYWDYAELRFYTSADKFTEAYVTPEQPTEEQIVTFLAITDPVDNISSVFCEPILFPSGFTDQIYTFTESPSFIFTYTFDTMPAGYYLFAWYLRNSTGTRYLVYVPLRVSTVIFRVLYHMDNGDWQAGSVRVIGRISKLADYTIYLDEVSSATGSLTDLDFSITFDKAGSEGLDHDYSIVFTNGTDTCNATGTYYVWEYNQDQADRGASGARDARAAYNVGTWTLIAVICLGAFVATQGKKELNV